MTDPAHPLSGAPSDPPPGAAPAAEPPATAAGAGTAGGLRALILPGGATDPGDSDVIGRALRAVREHLGLQVAYVSEFVGDQSVFRKVDAPGLEHLIKPGDARSLDDVYCRHILEGRLPELMPDTARFPLAAAMPITAAVPIGAHVSVPLRLSDGEVYGMFCCLGPAADPSLNERDLNMMRAFAELAAFEIDRDRDAVRARRDTQERIQALIDAGAIDILYQPIWSLRRERPVGFECLARFAAEPVRSPDQWFAEATAIGLGVELELLAIRSALAVIDRLPPGPYLAVNASPATVMDGGLRELLGRHPVERIVLEVTEHDCIEDFETLAAALAPLRARGLRLAIDDAGAGYSGLQQILQMKPDLIKLDRFLVQGIAGDPSRRAMASALSVFARETGSEIVAEGVEQETELAELRSLGVDSVQGYLLGRPQPFEAALATLARGAGPDEARRIARQRR